MSNLKDYTKVIIIALLTTIAGQLIARVFVKVDKIENAATKEDIKEVEKTAASYTDDKFEEHEKIHDETSKQYIQIQADLNIIKAHLINK